MENVKQCPNGRCADKTHSEAHAVVWRCDDCRAVGAIHCAHPDECGGMKQVASDHFVGVNKMVPNAKVSGARDD